MTNVPIDIALTGVEYTANPGAGLLSHVRIEFGYASELQYCSGSDIPVGAQFTFRNGFRTYQGARRLDEVRTYVRPFQSASWQLRRKLSLSYDTDAASCNPNGLHAPLRLLSSVQETGYAPGKPSITLPPVTFTYGRIERSLDEEVEIPELNLNGLGSGKRRLSREKAGGWPTVDSMWLDLDGDGAQDLLRSTPSSVPSRPCDFQWKRNLGNGRFEQNWRSSALPTLPWASTNARNMGSDAWEREQCSLAAQRFDRRATPNIDPVCGFPANYVSYRFMDVSGDGLPDLVTAMDYQSGQYDPTKDVNLLAMGQPGEPNVCSQPAPCRDPKTGDPIPCYFEPVSQSMPAAGDYVPDQTGCALDECRAPTCSPLDTDCPCSALYCLMGSTSVYSPFRAPPEEEHGPTGPDSAYWAWKGAPYPQAYGSAAVGPYIQQNAACRRRAETSCKGDRFVWRVFDNLGDGLFSQTPRVIDAPIPLESDRLTAELGGANLANASDWNAIVDIDGDGYDDAVWQFPQNNSYDYDDTGYFLVFRGDGTGHFLPDADGNPYRWPTPPTIDSPDGRRHIHQRAVGLGTAPSSTSNHDTIHITSTLTTLADVNGDGLPDYIDTQSAIAGRRQLNVYYNTGTGFETVAATVLAPYDELDTPNREVQVPLSLDPDTFELDSGYSVTTRRMVDLDGDGLLDMFAAPVPSTGTKNPWVHLDVNGNPDHAIAYVNVGDRLLPLGSSSKLDIMRDALERITLTYDQKWQVKTDFFDFDGDGYAEVFNADHDYNGNSIVDGCNPNSSGEWTALCGYTDVVARDSSTSAQGMHMLQRIDNGYGASVTFTYAPTTEVAPGTLGGRRTPAPVWVVTKMSVRPWPRCTRTCSGRGDIHVRVFPPGLQRR